MASSMGWCNPVPFSELTQRQQQIMEWLWSLPGGHSPSYSEIGEAVGLGVGPKRSGTRSPVSYQLEELELKGWVLRHRDARRIARALKWRDRAGRIPQAREAEYVAVPGLGLVPASPADQPVQIADLLWELPRDLVGSGDFELWQARGDSMSDASIVDGDLLVVRRQGAAEDGDTVIAMIDNEVTVKTFRRGPNGRTWLMPQNPDHKPIDGAFENGAVWGKLVAVLRSVGRPYRPRLS
jgi:repressor LexA